MKWTEEESHIERDKGWVLAGLGSKADKSNSNSGVNDFSDTLQWQFVSGLHTVSIKEASFQRTLRPLWKVQNPVE